MKAGEVSPVEPKAFRVLLHLLRNPQKLIPKEELLNAVWGETAVSENSLTRSIALLRRLLGDEARAPTLHRDGGHRRLPLGLQSRILRGISR